jgi:hypothetical protein
VLGADLLGFFILLLLELSRAFDLVEETHDLFYIVFFAGLFEGEADKTHVLLVNRGYLGLCDPGLLGFIEVRRNPGIEFVEVVKVGSVELVRDRRLVRGSAAPEVVPVDGSEEGVIFDLLDTVSAEPDICSHEGTLFRHQPHDKIRGVSRHLNVWGDLQVLAPLDDFAAGLFGVVRTERSVADQHLEEDGSDRPPVDDLGVPVLVEDFGSNIVGCPHE